jgi:DNA-binding transcriptional ArsR family regulator
MKHTDAVKALAALAQDTRLTAFRLLVEAGPAGLKVGELAERLKVPNATLSFHLKELTYTGLVKTEQQGRFISCMANFRAMDGLLQYLTENCCTGSPCEATPTTTCKPKKVPV